MRPLDTRRMLAAACRAVGVRAEPVEAIRLGENAIWRLPGGVVARIARPGQDAAAVREVLVARWLETAGVPAVRALADVDQPVAVEGRAVTFWRELPAHEHGNPVQVATALRRLHGLAPPVAFELPSLAPFVRLAERIDAATTLGADDRVWLREHLAELECRYRELPAGLPACVVHGDAWVGNVVSTADGQGVLLDLERCSIGPPEWDLVSTAIKHTTFGWVSAADYANFARVYGHDVTGWAGFELLRDIRELRMAAYVCQHAAEHPPARDEAALRVASLRGNAGPRPWAWTPAL